MWPRVITLGGVKTIGGKRRRRGRKPILSPLPGLQSLCENFDL